MTDILIPALVVSLVLLGIHSYYGLRIIQRNIIFTDLAIGQMAAFGAAISLFLFHGEGLYLTSLGFALLAGFIISVVSRRSKYLEAVIGLMYALGISGVFILLSNSPHGMEEFQRLMAYDILFTDMKDVIFVAILYACIGVIIFFIEKKTSGMVKEVLFFTTFAATVTSSVKLAGVLVVFAILLAPAFIAIQIALIKKLPELVKRNQLIMAWIIGTVINVTAIFISYNMDYPTGYTIVFTNAFFAIIMAFIGPKTISEEISTDE